MKIVVGQLHATFCLVKPFAFVIAVTQRVARRPDHLLERLDSRPRPVSRLTALAFASSVNGRTGTPATGARV
jgi:hypothetical protein